MQLWESLERLADPASSRVTDQAANALTASQRRELAVAFLSEALALAMAPQSHIVDRVAGLQAAHRVRADLPTEMPVRAQLARAQCELVAALESLGDAPAALQVASDARDGLPEGDSVQAERLTLEAAVIRLSFAAKQAPAGSLAAQLIAEATAGGATAGLEARIWATIVLLETPGQREAALTLAGQVTDALETHADPGSPGDSWRLLLGYHVGRAGLPDLTARLLAPLITSTDDATQDAARIVQRAVDGPGSDRRLQNTLLAAELAALPNEAEDDRLRIHHALANNFASLGEYRPALDHGSQELDLRTRIQGPDHPGTLDARQGIAFWTGLGGDPAAAVELSKDLLRDEERVLGPRASRTLTARYGIARFCENPAEALRLYRELLPDMEHGFGPDHRDTNATRNGIASSLGECGDTAGALSLFQDLLRREERALGPRHPQVLTIRQNIAGLTGKCGDAAGALRLLQELLPDQEQILGHRHPDTINTRGNLALWTGRCGDAPGALRLLQELLPDEIQILGPENQVTLATRSQIARMTGECGDKAEALRLHLELLADQQAALGIRHPDTLITRVNVGTCTDQCEDKPGALRLYQELLPDLKQVFGTEHPVTLLARNCIAGWAGQLGDTAEALRLYRKLLPDLECNLGSRHQATLTARANVANLARAGITETEA